MIAITNIRHSLHSTPRNKYDKRLMEVADVVIDNCGKIGDSATYFEGIPYPMYPTSSIANAFICGAISIEVAKELTDLKDEVEVFISANVDGGFDKNHKLMEKYTRGY